MVQYPAERSVGCGCWVKVYVCGEHLVVADQVLTSIMDQLWLDGMDPAHGVGEGGDGRRGGVIPQKDPGRMPGSLRIAAGQVPTEREE